MKKKARAHNTLPLVPLWHFPAPPIRLFPPYRSFIIHIFFITLPLPNIRPFLPLLSLFHPHFTRRNVFSIYFTFLSPTYFPTEAFSASRTQILSCLLLMGDDGRCIINGRSRNTRNSSKSNVSSSSRNNSDNGSSGSLIIVTEVQAAIVARLALSQLARRILTQTFLKRLVLNTDACSSQDAMRGIFTQPMKSPSK